MKIEELFIISIILAALIWLIKSLRKVKYEVWVKVVYEDWHKVATFKTLKDANNKANELREKNKLLIEQIQITKIY